MRCVFLDVGAGPIPYFSYQLKPFDTWGHTVAQFAEALSYTPEDRLGSTEPLTEINIRKIPVSKGRPAGV
jgi:hypothetical protein